MSSGAEAVRQKWTRSSLGALIAGRGVTVNPASSPSTLFELFSIPSHATGIPEVVLGKDIGSSKQAVSPGSVLLSKINPRINRVWVVPEKGVNVQIASTEWMVFPKSEAVVPTFLAYFLQQDELRHFLAQNVSGVGGSLMRVKPSTLRDFEFSYPDIQNQADIVAHLDLQLSRLDAAVAALKRAQANLKRYRASVLQAAVTGRLVPTEHDLAQAEGRDYETGEQLLERILTERRRTWSGKGKYKEPGIVDVQTLELPPVPCGWTWANIDQLSAYTPNAITDGPFGSNLKTEHYTESGPRVIRLQNIGDGVFRDVSSYISQERYELLKRHQATAGDIIIAGLGETLPRACRVPEGLGPAIVKADCIRFRPQSEIEPQFLMHALNCESTRHRTTEQLHGVGRPRMNLTEIKSIALPLPPLAEQVRIVAEVERRLSVADRLEATLEANLRRATRLRQAILKKAFTFEDGNEEAGAQKEEG